MHPDEDIDTDPDDTAAPLFNSDGELIGYDFLEDFDFLPAQWRDN